MVLQVKSKKNQSVVSNQEYTHYICIYLVGGYSATLYTRFAQTFTHFQWEQDKVKQIHRELRSVLFCFSRKTK